MELLEHPFGPIVRNDSRVLILGSFPSVVSREKSFYYANSSNRFWPVMSLIFEEQINDREEFCYRHHIALWDVIKSCTIHGSYDSSISNVTVNDIGGLAENTQIKVIFTTGNRASELFDKYVVTDIRHISLPSTSSANARMKIQDLAEKYRVIKEYAEEN